MKFTLTYRGPLKAGGDIQNKWAIRDQIAPQIEELWRIAPALRATLEASKFPKAGGFLIQKHHDYDAPQVPDAPKLPIADNQIDLCKPIKRKGYNFSPLVRDSFALNCGLKILFLRKEEPGKLYQGGDLDNRIKCLLDALSIPQPDQILADKANNAPIHCLLEDDRLVTKLEVDTARLLGVPEANKHEVNLIIEVDVRVTTARIYNQAFLGD